MLQAFGVHFLKEVTRQQLVRAINNHLPQNAERKALLTAPKTSLLKPLAQGLLAKKIILAALMVAELPLYIRLLAAWHGSPRRPLDIAAF